MNFNEKLQELRKQKTPMRTIYYGMVQEHKSRERKLKRLLIT